MLVRKSLREDRARGRALLSTSDIAFSESYYGYSASGHPLSGFLTHYLLVLLHSKLFEYFTLMTSGEFGVEREAQQKLDINRLPFIPPENLSTDQRQSIETCAQSLISNHPDWPSLDYTVGQLYGLSTTDQQVLSDTLMVNAPYASARDKGLAKTEEEQAQAFIVCLKKELAGVLGAGGHQVQVQFLNNIKAALPWRFISITLEGRSAPLELPENWIQQVSSLGVSRITLLSSTQPSLIVGLLNRYRYWTQSQARLLASDLVWEYGARLEELSQQCVD